jgi:transcriptional regulator with XRE-family HTH domain
MKNIVDEILGSIPSYEKRANRISNDIGAQIYKYMKESNINQRQLAEKLGKKESEISKWLNGNHNFTIETIAKIEDILGKNIVLVPMFAKEDMNFEYRPIVHNIIDINTSWIVTTDKYLDFGRERYPIIKRERLIDNGLFGSKFELSEEKVTYSEKTGTY